MQNKIIKIIIIKGERERERERKREREKERERERDRETERDREAERQRERQRLRERSIVVDVFAFPMHTSMVTGKSNLVVGDVVRLADEFLSHSIDLEHYSLPASCSVFAKLSHK